MQSDMTDPISFREEVAPQNEELNSQEELSNQETASFSPSPELTTLEPQNQTFILITDDEIVDLKSNLLLPSGLRAYNTGDTTYVEYKEVQLTPIPELTTGQMEIIH